MHFYKLVQFHILIFFRAITYIRVSDSGHPIRYSRQYCTNKPGHKLYHCIPAHSTQHHRILHYPTILHMKTFFVPFYHPRKKISSKSKLSHSSLINPRALYTIQSNSEYYSKIDSIKSERFPLGQNINKLIQPKQVDSNKNLSRIFSLFLFSRLWLGLGLGLRLRLWSNNPLARSRYVSLHVNK